MIQAAPTGDSNDNNLLHRIRRQVSSTLGTRCYGGCGGRCCNYGGDCLRNGDCLGGDGCCYYVLLRHEVNLELYYGMKNNFCHGTTKEISSLGSENIHLVLLRHEVNSELYYGMKSVKSEYKFYI
ncbi:unnamed protein product [Rotaria sordida]|uniref:Uncharacterized protein n=1 Tax=Rotaria sordida TaxID=392033 RepID=A0A814W7S8_9BILA|nr:unnamed protein product [Rotaria sordida]